MNVVFDLGGVLFRWRPHLLLMSALSPRVIDDDAARALALVVFSGPWLDFDRGTISVPDLAASLSRRAGITVDEALRIVDAVPSELAPIEHSVSLLPRLKARGHRLFYLSNMPVPYIEHLERSHGFLDLFEAGIYSARVGDIKPEAAIYDKAERLFGSPAYELLFIDDLMTNIIAARERGWQGIHFENPAQCESDLEALGLL